MDRGAVGHLGRTRTTREGVRWWWPGEGSLFSRSQGGGVIRGERERREGQLSLAGPGGSENTDEDMKCVEREAHSVIPHVDRYRGERHVL